MSGRKGIISTPKLTTFRPHEMDINDQENMPGLINDPNKREKNDIQIIARL